ncbi:MAG: hypothetical protein ACE5K3_00955 [bacterium]
MLEEIKKELDKRVKWWMMCVDKKGRWVIKQLISWYTLSGAWQN